MKQYNHINIPIFIQHMGCPNKCVFCDQNTISGAHIFCFDKVREEIEAHLLTKGERECEIAFFGGSFTGIDRELMISLLDLAQEYVDRGDVSGIRMSTRPDYISEEICQILSKYTISQVELGIQSLDDSVLKASKRGHKKEASLDACRLLKKYGFSFVGQMMVGLPEATTESEIETARTICRCGADGARIYPCVVFKNTELAEMYEMGLYIPLTVEDAVERGSAVLSVFEKYNVPILKIGLHENENLHSDNTYYAGPNHPALGELIRSRLFRNKIENELKDADLNGKNLTIFVPHGMVSAASGQKKQNKAYIMEKYGVKCVKILENRSLLRYNISIDIK